MGLHVRHSLCKCSPSITKDIKYNDQNNKSIYIVISVLKCSLWRNSKFCNNCSPVKTYLNFLTLSN